MENILVKKITPLWVMATGFAEENYDRCTLATRLTIRNIASAMLFTAFVSASSITAIVHCFFHTSEPFIAVLVELSVFVVWFILILQFDKSVLTANRYGLAALFRFIAIGAFASAHAFIGLVLFFPDDIQRVLNEDKISIMAQDKAVSEAQITALKSENNGLNLKIQAAKTLIDKQAERFQAVTQNLDNYPIVDRKKVFSAAKNVYESQTQGYRDHTDLLLKHIQRNLAEIESINRAFLMLTDARSIDKLGFVSYLEVVEKLVFDGNYGILFWFSIGVFIMAFVVEGLTLIYKSSKALFEYYEIERIYLDVNLNHQAEEAKRIIKPNIENPQKNGKDINPSFDPKNDNTFYQ